MLFYYLLKVLRHLAHDRFEEVASTRNDPSSWFLDAAAALAEDSDEEEDDNDDNDGEESSDEDNE
jgi:hypothetical protein